MAWPGGRRDTARRAPRGQGTDDESNGVQEELWKANALRTLPVLMGASDMMVCGEDLGMIPACVHPVMERLGLLGALDAGSRA